jgi:hypothetical protein
VERIIEGKKATKEEFISRPFSMLDRLETPHPSETAHRPVSFAISCSSKSFSVCVDMFCRFQIYSLGWILRCWWLMSEESRVVDADALVWRRQLGWAFSRGGFSRWVSHPGLIPPTSSRAHSTTAHKRQARYHTCIPADRLKRPRFPRSPPFQA